MQQTKTTIGNPPILDCVVNETKKRKTLKQNMHKTTTKVHTFLPPPLIFAAELADASVLSDCQIVDLCGCVDKITLT